MNYTFGFIGTGNMGGALAVAAKKGNDEFSALLADANSEKAAELANQLGCDSGEVKAVAEKCKYIFLGVKPQIMNLVIDEIAPVLKARKDRFVLVSMAAGVSMSKITNMLGEDCPIIRIMPNVAAAVGEGMILYTANDLVTDEEKAEFVSLMKCAGRFELLDEGLFDAGCALSGSGPAFVFVFIEALADGAVSCGLPRAQALSLAAQTVFGSAKLMQETGRHPADLKDSVCSPAGTTIAGVGALENADFRSAAIKAVKAAYNRSIELGKQ